jgi:hypothetical protein
MLVSCGKSDVTPTKASRSAAFDVTVKWRLNPRKRTELAHGGCFVELPQNAPLKSGHRLCGTESQRKKQFPVWQISS